MTGTKYTVIGAVLILVLVAGFVIGRFSTGAQSSVNQVYTPDATLIDPVTGRPVVVADRNDTSGIRDTLREALLADVSPETLAEPVVTDEVLPDVSSMEADGSILGDGNITTSPQAGFIYSCQQQFNGGGAHATGEWIQDVFWYPEDKVHVDGSVSWPNIVNIVKAEGARLITSNGLPNHTTGIFPIAATDDAYQYDRNPNAIAEQDVLMQLPLMPTLASSPSCVPLGTIGIGLNGVAIYNGLDGQGLDAAAHEIQDTCAGHPERSGEYHYHSESECLVNSFYEGAESTIVGYAIDGFGIFSSLEYGETLTNDDLDACHGHTHQIPWDGVYENMYHYHMTKEYPYTLGCFMGTPQSIVQSADNNSQNTAPPGPGSPPPNGQTPPPPRSNQ